MLHGIEFHQVRLISFSEIRRWPTTITKWRLSANHARVWPFLSPWWSCVFYKISRITNY